MTSRPWAPVRTATARLRQTRSRGADSSSWHQVCQSARLTAARLLSRVAGPQLEENICSLLIEDLPNLGDPELESLRAACRHADSKVKITSRYALGEEQRSSLALALGRVGVKPALCEFGLDPELIAGFRISLGAWVLRCNLQDELRFFAEAQHGGT